MNIGSGSDSSGNNSISFRFSFFTFIVFDIPHFVLPSLVFVILNKKKTAKKYYETQKSKETKTTLTTRKMCAHRHTHCVSIGPSYIYVCHFFSSVHCVHFHSVASSPLKIFQLFIIIIISTWFNEIVQKWEGKGRIAHNHTFYQKRMLFWRRLLAAFSFCMLLPLLLHSKK